MPTPIMTPKPGERLLRFVGDRIRFTLADGSGSGGWRAMLRTNLGRAAARRHEIVAANALGPGFAGQSWRDVPMQRNGDGWEIELPLAETGYFKAKPYLLDTEGWQHWPEGSDVAIIVHPDFARTANTIYCAFPRLFGATKKLASTRDEKLQALLAQLDKDNFTAIPPSGKFRDLIKQLPHIVQTLGCRILHLLPVQPVPTTYARMGRFGSPYASLDLTTVDPALVEFDRLTTGVDQFCELASAAHTLGARVFIDIVLNHTGWGSMLQENHPEFFVRKDDGAFASPGAWGVTWEDLVELKQDGVGLWDIFADALLVWCRRGVDGFRCDAGYKIPVIAWEYIIARVQDEFPGTIFLLEGLGGPWEATEALLTEGGMQWAYSELFQNYSGRQVSDYLDYSKCQSSRIGTYVHYSETHDNDRLAEKGRAWSLMRNRLCALTSASGGFGFTCGVEWLATEKILVHGCTGLNWGSKDNIVPELAQLNQLISNHPCFFDGAKLTRLSVPDSPVYALLRESAEGKDTVLVLVHTDIEKANLLALEMPQEAASRSLSNFKFDLLGQQLPDISTVKGKLTVKLAAGAAYCLSPVQKPVGLSGDDYRHTRAYAAWGLESLNKIMPAEHVDRFDWRWFAEQVARSLENFLTAAAEFAARNARVPHQEPSPHPDPLPSHRMGAEREQQADANCFVEAQKQSSGSGVQCANSSGNSLAEVLREAELGKVFPRVITWTLLDRRRVTLVPSGHWLLIEDTTPFRVAIVLKNGRGATATAHAQSILVGEKHIAVFAPRFGDAELALERHATTSQKINAKIRFLAPEPKPAAINLQSSSLVLLTNERGGMARMRLDLGRVNSKYDCVLGANLDPNVPVDRHIFVKRIRVWVSADRFLSPLDAKNLAAFQPGPPAKWQFVANAADGRTVEIELAASMPEGKNTTVFQFSRPAVEHACCKQLPADADVRLTVRVDIEDRNFHWETKHNGGAESHFSTNTHPLEQAIGFSFTPASDRQLKVFASGGNYHPQPEWCDNVPHPVEQSRGQVASGDTFSPGWFEIPLPKGASVKLVASAEPDDQVQSPDLKDFEFKSEHPNAGLDAGAFFEKQLLHAAGQFVVRRGGGKTVIAGYPWFLDWGRDTLIACRGLIAAGMIDEATQILLTFGKFEHKGTLPNALFGDDVSKRNTSDAPLWFAIACEELAAASPGKAGGSFFDVPVDSTRTVRDVLMSIAENYIQGTPNGIRMDTDSALIWSPACFTWMDTNHPAGTPREGYPVEIQALWVRLLRLLEKLSGADKQEILRELAGRATASFEKSFWLEDKGWFADVLLANNSQRAAGAVVDNALRSNCLLAVSLGLVTGERARRCVDAAQKYLVVPGGLRSLAPLPETVPLKILSNDGRPLNNPVEPYWPRYEGDEDTRRKPAYHNGTAWTWMYPNFCEALARAWDISPDAVAAAKSYLGGMEQIMYEGCLGQVPEILDGDAPHIQRGCDAQAWGVTETLRVWKWLNSTGAQAK